MRTVTTLEALSHEQQPVVLAAGVFDGVHLGHQAVIERARKIARSANGQIWVMTFDPHPLKILRPSLAPAMLTSTPHKLRLLQALDIDGCIVLPFTSQLATVEPEPFIEQLCTTIPSLSGMVVGSNWTFGHNAKGNVGMLEKLARTLRISATVVEGVQWKGQPISSTRIRQAVDAGHLDDAAHMLGRPFSILGTVVHGRKMGRQLGFRTANVDPHNEVRPPAGIYAARAIVQQKSYKAAAYLSDRKSDYSSDEIVEVHLMDQDLDLYDAEMEILFLKRLREDRTFATEDELKNQIGRDIEEARRILAT